MFSVLYTHVHIQASVSTHTHTHEVGWRDVTLGKVQGCQHTLKGWQGGVALYPSTGRRSQKGLRLTNRQTASQARSVSSRFSEILPQSTHT